MGLAITQAIGLTGMLQMGIRQMAEMENQMTSVERILEYTAVQSEPPLESLPGKCHSFCVINVMKNGPSFSWSVLVQVFVLSVHKPKCSVVSTSCFASYSQQLFIFIFALLCIFHNWRLHHHMKPESILCHDAKELVNRTVWHKQPVLWLFLPVSQ